MRRSIVTTLALSASIGLTACGGGSSNPLTTGSGSAGGSGSGNAGSTASSDTASSSGTAAAPAPGGGGEITVGSANFPENVLLAEIYAAALEDQGVTVKKTLNIGSRETYVKGLEDGSIDVIPEYTGGLGQYLNPEITATSGEDVLADVEQHLPEGLQLLEISEAEDKDALVVTRQSADDLGLQAIPDLEGKSEGLIIGGPPEFQTRPKGLKGLESEYGLTFKQFRPLAAGSNLTVQALKNGQVDAANIFTTDPAIQENDFVILEDPKALFAAQNVVPLIRTDKVNPAVEEALNGVSAALTTENLTEMMVKVVSDGEDPSSVAKEFVASEVTG